MNITQETRRKIDRFAKEQSRHYLEAAEMTYLEKLRAKAEQTRRKAGGKLARFKGRSDQAAEAQADMLLYMSDYVSDLMAQGLSEADAFEKARANLTAPGGSERGGELRERLRQYYETRDPAEEEVAGLFFGGFAVTGLVAGALLGFLTGGGRTALLAGGWIDAVIGAGVGLFLGIGLGMIVNAVFAARRRP